MCCLKPWISTETFSTSPWMAWRKAKNKHQVKRNLMYNKDIEGLDLQSHVGKSLALEGSSPINCIDVNFTLNHIPGTYSFHVYTAFQYSSANGPFMVWLHLVFYSLCLIRTISGRNGGQQFQRIWWKCNYIHTCWQQRQSIWKENLHNGLQWWNALKIWYSAS